LSLVNYRKNSGSRARLINKRADLHVHGLLPCPELVLPSTVLLPDQFEEEEVKDENEKTN
jgi:hypothetical protein